MKRPRLVSVGLFILAGSLAVTAQNAAQTGAARLRTLFFQRMFDSGALEGARLVAASPDATELKAWYVLNLVRDGDERTAVALAEEMTKKKPQDGWSWFALAGALNYQHERPADAIAAAEKALALLPGNRDAIWIRAQTLASDEKHRDEAIAFVDAQRARLKNPVDILVARAYSLYLKASASHDDAAMKAAFAAFEEARQVDATNLSAWFLPGSYLSGLRRADEARPLLKQALALAPDATDVHREYWRAVNGSRELTAEQKRQEIDADVKAFLQSNGDRPEALSAVASISEQMKWADRQREAEEKILKNFPDTTQAEWVYVNRWRSLGEAADGRKSRQYRQILQEYVARPRHFSDNLLGEAYENLFFVLSDDKSVAADELYLTAAGAVKYETNNPHITYASIPIALADHKVHLADAERIAREGLAVLRKKIESQKSFYKSPGEYDHAMGWYTGQGHDALGWVLFAEGRTADAEKELLAAYELNHEDRRTLDHLGRFYLAKNDEAKAEEYFVEGLGIQGLGTNPCDTSLRSLYEKRHGGLEGIDGYLATLKDAHRAKRRDAVLAARLATPEPAPVFNLKTLDGKRVSLDSLKGKIVVVNFWGIWCGWCVQELPDYQKLYEKYASDPDVAILTIDNDQNPDDVPPWMAQKKYTFPVLLDEGYVSDKARIQGFPTTWFIDREGRKVFVKEGWSEQLLEEFTWRIEAIRGRTTPRQISTSGKPSRAAAARRRSSSVMSGREAGRRSALSHAAASCRASAARSGWTRSIRRATSRTSSPASISIQLAASASRRANASAACAAVREPSRSSRAIAEAHSTGVAHHTIAGCSP